MYTFIRFYWDWILFSFLTIAFAIIIFVLKFAFWSYHIFLPASQSSRCLGCLSTEIVNIHNRVLSRIISILEDPSLESNTSDPGLPLSEFSDDWEDLFDDNDAELPTYSVVTPPGRLLLVRGIRDGWITSSCSSRIFGGVLNRTMDCWMITLFHSLHQGKIHPLVKEFQIADSLVQLQLCPHPLYVSGPNKSRYGGYAAVEERYMLYRIPTDSEFISNLAFRQPPFTAEKLCTIFTSLTAVVRDLHSCGIAHGSLDDDGVVVLNESKALLVNFSSISTEKSKQLNDIVAIINLFCFVGSRAYCRTISDFCRRIVSGKMNEYAASIGSFRELESIASVEKPGQHDRIISCFEKIGNGK